MHINNFYNAFEKMRSENLGKQFERRDLGMLATKYGIYFNSTMWACGLGILFTTAKLGSKYVYLFKNNVTSRESVNLIAENIRQYEHNDARKIEHAKSILRRFGIHNID